MKVIPRLRKEGEPTHELFVLIPTDKVIDSPVGKLKANQWIEVEEVNLSDPGILEIRLDPIIYLKNVKK